MCSTQETSSAQYILQQYLAASGGQRLLSSIRNSYAMGKVRMVATEFETGGRVVRNRMAAQRAEPGRSCCGRWRQRCGTLSWLSVGARCTPAAMASLCGATPRGSAHIPPRALFAHSAELFRYSGSVNRFGQHVCSCVLCFKGM
jgi:hypothetical protein